MSAISLLILPLCLYAYGHHQDLHVLTHSSPTRRSSDLDDIGAHVGDRLLHVLGAHQVLALLEHHFALVVHHVVVHPKVLAARSEEHTSELQSLMRSSYPALCSKKKTTNGNKRISTYTPQMPAPST